MRGRGNFGGKLLELRCGKLVKFAPAVEAEAERLSLAAEHDVFRHADVRQQRLFLKYHSNPGVIRLRDAPQRDFTTAKHDSPTVERVEPGQHLEQRRLAGAILANKAHDLVRANFDRYLVQRLNLGKPLAQFLDAQYCSSFDDSKPAAQMPSRDEHRAKNDRPLYGLLNVG